MIDAMPQVKNLKIVVVLYSRNIASAAINKKPVA